MITLNEIISDGFKESNEVRLLGTTLDSSKSHLVAGNMLSGIDEIHPKMFGAPGDSGSLH